MPGLTHDAGMLKGVPLNPELGLITPVTIGLHGVGVGVGLGVGVGVGVGLGVTVAVDRGDNVAGGVGALVAGCRVGVGVPRLQATAPGGHGEVEGVAALHVDVAARHGVAPPPVATGVAVLAPGLVVCEGMTGTLDPGEPEAPAGAPFWGDPRWPTLKSSPTATPPMTIANAGPVTNGRRKRHPAACGCAALGATALPSRNAVGPASAAMKSATAAWIRGRPPGIVSPYAA